MAPLFLLNYFLFNLFFILAKKCRAEAPSAPPLRGPCHKTIYQESVIGNVEEICETVAETRRLTRVSSVGLVTFTRVSVAAVTAEPYNFFTCFRQVSVEGNKCFRKCNFLYFHRRNQTLRFTEIQGYVPETRFSLVSVDVIRQNADGNTSLLFGNRFLSCFC